VFAGRRYRFSSAFGRPLHLPFVGVHALPAWFGSRDDPLDRRDHEQVNFLDRLDGLAAGVSAIAGSRSP
jgi:hypothetical protein